MTVATELVPTTSADWRDRERELEHRAEVALRSSEDFLTELAVARLDGHDSKAADLRAAAAKALADSQELSSAAKLAGVRARQAAEAEHATEQAALRREAYGLAAQRLELRIALSDAEREHRANLGRINRELHVDGARVAELDRALGGPVDGRLAALLEGLEPYDREKLLGYVVEYKALAESPV